MRTLLILVLAGIPGLAAASARPGADPSSEPDGEARIFMDMFEAGLKTFYVGMSEEYWSFYTQGDPGRTALYEKIQSEILRDPRTFDRLRAWRGRIADPLLARRVELLYRAFAAAQVTAQEKIYTLQNRLQKIQINYRATLGGEPATQNRLADALRFEPDRKRREEAWRARNQVGRELAPGLADLVRIRNEEARKLGYGSFYSMSLLLADIDEDALFRMLEDLDRLSRAPFRKWQARLRSTLKVGELESWDTQYDYDRLLEKLKPYFPKDQILPRLKATFRAIDLDIDRMPIQVDGEERSGKSEHAFSFPINVPTDIRILANAADGVASARTLFHEMGHSVYSASIQQPTYLLQDSASSCFTEGIGQLFPMFLEQEEWLTGVAGVPADLARAYRRRIREDAPASVRSYLVMLHFEREAYRNPDQDLTRFWWVTNARYLDLPPHPEVDAWASIIHFTSHPAYYPNYLLADLIAAQLMHKLIAVQGKVLGNPTTGEFLRTRIFARGASIPWPQLLAETTGEPLNAEYYIREKLGAGNGAD